MKKLFYQVDTRHCVFQVDTPNCKIYNFDTRHWPAPFKGPYVSLVSQSKINACFTRYEAAKITAEHDNNTNPWSLTSMFSFAKLVLIIYYYSVKDMTLLSFLLLSQVSTIVSSFCSQRKSKYGNFKSKWKWPPKNLWKATSRFQGKNAQSPKKPICI